MPSWFDAEVAQLEQRTRSLRGSANLVLFYGSSSFTLWQNLPDHFPGYTVANHGFGGATLADCVEYFDRLVAAYAPSAIVLYAGDNDLGDGRSPERVLELLQAFAAAKRKRLGAVPMAYVSIKISPARFSLMHAITYTNLIAQRWLAEQSDASFVDSTRRMVSRGLVPLMSYYTHDPLHMNAEGYRVLGKTISEYLADVEGRHGALATPGVDATPAWVLPSEDRWAVQATGLAA